MVTTTLDGVEAGGVGIISGISPTVANGAQYTFTINGYVTVTSVATDIWQISPDGATWYSLSAAPIVLFIVSGKVRVFNMSGANQVYAWVGYNPAV